MGYINKTISKRDSYVNRSLPLTEEKAEKARVLLRGIHARLGTWAKVAKAFNDAFDDKTINNWATPGSLIPARHSEQILAVFRANKHLPRKLK